MLRIRLNARLGDFLLDLAMSCPSRWLGIFGPSGSGKSTLLECVSGLLRPDSGEIWLGEVCLFDSRAGLCLAPEARGVAHLFQSPSLFPHLTVRGNLQYGRRRLASGLELNLDTVVDLLELGDLLDRYPRTLSGGEQQRTALGRALLSSPRLLLLDEPLTGLDEARKGRILPYLQRLRGLGVPLVYVSHALGEVVALTDHVAVLERGRLAAQGSPLEVLELAGVEPAARSEGIENLFEVEVLEHDPGAGLTRARWGERTLALPLAPAHQAGELRRAACRACDLVLRPEPARASPRNHWPARVESLVAHPDRVNVRLQVDGHRLKSDVTAEAVEELKLVPGRELEVQIKATSLRWLP